MSNENTNASSAEQDLQKLLEKLRGIGESDFTYVRDGDFENPEIKEAVNGMINSIMTRNNHFLVRVNDAMIRIADNSCLKVMLDEIDYQSEPVRHLKETKDWLEQSKEETVERGIRVSMLSKLIRRSLEEYAKRFEEAFNAMNKLIVSSEIGPEGQAIVVDLAENFNYLRRDMQANALRMRDMYSDISDMQSSIEEQGESYLTLFSAIDSVTGSFDKLYTDCFEVGRHLFRISRDIDHARSDMFRQNSWPLLHDKLKIFTVDHLTLSWRLYNYAIGYEELAITQLNNPDSCKFGLWFNSELERDSDLSHSEEFKKAVTLHYELHDHAVSCFLLKESYKNKEALAEFQATLETYTRFEAAMDDLHKYLNSIGIFDETEVWKYNGVKS